MMTRRNNVAMREWNDNIDHGNNLDWFCRWSKTFFLIACIKEDDVLEFFDTSADFGPYFWP